MTFEVASIFFIISGFKWSSSHVMPSFMSTLSVMESQLIMCLSNQWLYGTKTTHTSNVGTEYKFAQNTSNYWNKSKTVTVSFSETLTSSPCRLHMHQEVVSCHVKCICGNDLQDWQLTFILRHLISFSCPGYGVYIRQVFKLLRVVAYERVWIVNRRQWNK